MRELLKRVFLRVNWRLSIALVGWLLAEFDLATTSEVDRRTLSATCFLVIIASIASWQNRIGKRVPRTPRVVEEMKDEA